MSHSSGHPTGYEKKDINIRKVVVYSIISIILVILSIVLLDEWYLKTKEEIYQEMVLKPKNQELLQLRAREDSLLNSYGKDDSTGAYRIPIDSAIALTVKENGTGGEK
ncbi:MAG: hypothetical protein ACREBV_03565 [Candidatus Zixiibacteriota bacterium]